MRLQKLKDAKEPNNGVSVLYASSIVATVMPLAKNAAAAIINIAALINPATKREDIFSTMW